MLLADVPALYSAARGSIGGASVRVTVTLDGSRIAAVHVSPGVQLKEDNERLWNAFSELLFGGSTQVPRAARQGD